jgi:hypothetical protein
MLKCFILISAQTSVTNVDFTYPAARRNPQSIFKILPAVDGAVNQAVLKNRWHLETTCRPLSGQHGRDEDVLFHFHVWLVVGFSPST